VTKAVTFRGLEERECPLAKCAYCNQETKLYEYGEPICLKCANIPQEIEESSHPKDDRKASGR